jgi:hypothetical protein
MSFLSPVPVRFHGLLLRLGNAAVYLGIAPVPNGFFNFRVNVATEKKKLARTNLRKFLGKGASQFLATRLIALEVEPVALRRVAPRRAAQGSASAFRPLPPAQRRFGAAAARTGLSQRDKRYLQETGMRHHVRLAGEGRSKPGLHPV